MQLCPHYTHLDANTLTMVYNDTMQLFKDGISLDGIKLGSEIKDACDGTK